MNTPLRLASARPSMLLLAAMICTLLFVRHSVGAELPTEVRADLDARIAAFMEKSKTPGLSAAFVVDHELLYERGYGLADIENNVPATPDTVYRLASISKMLTAVGAMQLVEAGSLDLAAPVQQYVPGFPEKQAPITCELLLKHQSGIRHYKGDEVRSAKAYPHVSDSFAVFQDDPLLFNPGEKFSYTTYGFNLVGAVIEGASGEDYVDYMLEHVCRPAGMVNIRPDSPAKIIPHRAAGYRKSGPVLVNDIAVDISNKIPGGGWCATPGELARFAIALCQGKLVSAESLEQMWTPQKTAGGEQTNVGYGCFIDALDGDRLISHSGGQPKVSTFLVFSPSKKTAVALMCNLRGAGLKPLALELMGVLGKAGVETASVPAKAP